MPGVKVVGLLVWKGWQVVWRPATTGQAGGGGVGPVPLATQLGRHSTVWEAPHGLGGIPNGMQKSPEAQLSAGSLLYDEHLLPVGTDPVL